MSNTKIDLIRQALGSAESSLKLAKQLLSELEPGAGKNRGVATPKKEKEGIIGDFDGEQMVTESGDKHPVPANYASKSLLVVGDKLKLIEENGEKRFKQVEHVKRHRTTGILAKKEGKWKAVTPEGSYKVLPAAVEHFGGDVGDEIVLHLPAGNLVANYGALESVNKKSKGEEETKPTAGQPQQKTEKKVEKTPARPQQRAVKPKTEKEPKPKVEKPKDKELGKKQEAPAEKPKPPEAVKAETVKATVSEDELT